MAPDGSTNEIARDLLEANEDRLAALAPVLMDRVAEEIGLPAPPLDHKWPADVIEATREFLVCVATDDMERLGASGGIVERSCSLPSTSTPRPSSGCRSLRTHWPPPFARSWPTSTASSGLPCRSPSFPTPSRWGSGSAPFGPSSTRGRPLSTTPCSSSSAWPTRSPCGPCGASTSESSTGCRGPACGARRDAPPVVAPVGQPAGDRPGPHGSPADRERSSAPVT